MPPALRGPVSLFRGKIRGKPLTVLLTKRHWTLIDAAAKRLVLSRANLVGLLLENNAQTVQWPKLPPRRQGWIAADLFSLIRCAVIRIGPAKLIFEG